jgi:hypothetical protein
MNGHLDVVQWARASGCNWDLDVIRNHDLDGSVVAWINSNSS